MRKNKGIKMKNTFTFNGNIEDQINDFKVFLDSFEAKENIKIKFIVDSTRKISQAFLALKPIQELWMIIKKWNF